MIRVGIMPPMFLIRLYSWLVLSLDGFIALVSCG